jgi:hypothetical protein
MTRGADYTHGYIIRPELQRIDFDCSGIGYSRIT